MLNRLNERLYLSQLATDMAIDANGFKVRGILCVLI